MSSAVTGKGVPVRVPSRSVRSGVLRFVRMAVAFVVVAGSLGLATATATAQSGGGSICPTDGAEGYSDADHGSPTHRDDIACLKELGISEAGDTYRPGDDMTRSEMAAFMVNTYMALTDMEAQPEEHMFVDIEGDPNEDHIAAISPNGLNITKGTSETTYSPGEPVFRGQMALFLTRLYRAVMGSDAPMGDTPFTDLTESPTTEERNAIGQLYALGVTKGTTATTFSRGVNVTREQMASFVARLYRHIDALETPDAPTGVTAAISGDEGDSLDVSWEASDGADSYVVQWKSGDDDYSEDNQRSVDEVMTNFDELTKGTSYTFRVAGVNDRGAGDWSDEASASPGTVPGAVGSFTVVAGAAAGTLDLSWAAPEDDGGTPVTGYKVQWATGRDAPTTTEIEDASATSHTITGLKTGVNYRVHIQAVNAAGDGAITAPAASAQRSVQSTASVGAGSVKVGLPPATDQAAVREGKRFASLTWRRPVLRTGENLVADGAYQIQRKCGTQDWPARLTTGDTGPRRDHNVSDARAVSQDPDDPPKATVSLDLDTHVALLGGEVGAGTLTNGVECTFRVRALTYIDKAATATNALRTQVESVEPTLYGAWVTGTGTPLGAPGKPATPTMHEANMALEISWTPPMTGTPPKVNDGGTPITGYKIAWESGAPEGDVTVAADATSHTITGLTNGLQYSVTIQAVNARGASDTAPAVLNGETPAGVTANVTVATPKAVPAAPTNVRVTQPPAPAQGQPDLRGSRLIVHWDAPAGSVTGYTVERRTSATKTPPAAAGDWGALVGADVDEDSETPNVGGPHTGTGTMVTDGILPDHRGDSFDYRVRAVNGAGSGPWSMFASGTAAALPDRVNPRSIEARPGDGSLILTWNAADGNGSDVTHYNVRYAANRLGSEPWGQPRRVDASALPNTVITGLENGVPYVIGITAVNAVGASPEAETDTNPTPKAGVVAGPARVTAVPSPTGTTDGTTLDVTWSAVPNVSAYLVQRLDTTANPTSGWTTFEATGDAAKTINSVGYFDAAKARKATITGLTKGTTYVVRVRPVTQPMIGGQAQDEAVFGAPGFSAPVKTASTPATAPGSVTLTQPAKTTTIRVTWTPPTDATTEGITGYKITWYPTESTVTGNRGSATVGADDKSYDITGLSAFGEEITVTVASVNKVGVGAASDATAATSKHTLTRATS